MSLLEFWNLFLRQLLYIISLLIFLFINAAWFALTYCFFRGAYFSRVLLIVILKELKLKNSAFLVKYSLRSLIKTSLLKFL